MIFSTGASILIFGLIAVHFTSPWTYDWRDYVAGAAIAIGTGLCTFSLFNFASRYLI
jgi:hypothetical protein